MAPVLGLTMAGTPGPVLAHSFGRVYNLPVPFWLYAWSAAAALLASFLVVGYFVSVEDARSGQRPRQDSPVVLAVPAGVILALKFLSVAGLLICLLTGFWGTSSHYDNFSMTFFWIVFLLGFAYATALAGDWYAVINPWRVLGELLARVFRRYPQGLWRYPQRLGYWPACGFYATFIWIELLGDVTPFSLATMLAVYSVLNLLGIGLIGQRDWFRHCEFFAVFLRLIASMAPIEFVPTPGRPGARLGLRAPFAGVVQSRAEGMSLLLFVLFMLSSTAFDGLRETEIWRRWFWLDLYHAGLRDWVGRNPLAAFPAMRELFFYWQGFWLLASPLLYLGVYLSFVWLMRQVTRGGLPVSVLALRFAPTLLPIALVYHITHYYTLIQSQGVKIISLASDPFGWGWNLFGTADWLQRSLIPDAGTVWHVQVLLIVAGHVVSVYLAHRVALELFGSRRRAVLSQLPMLGLMLLFTTAGLWILSQPLQAAA